MTDPLFDVLKTKCELSYDGSTMYKLDGELHRVDGPAYESPSGIKYWFRYGKLHREDGPAITGVGYDRWYRDGKLHREDGPAVEFSDGKGTWYINGVYQDDQPL